MSDAAGLPAPSEKFAKLRLPVEGGVRIWAISAIHGDVERLMALHDRLEVGFRQTDRLVYLGNLIGHSARIVDCLNEVLQFRRAILARPGMFADDIVFLRGAQEEMWQKLMQLQFAREPKQVLTWALAQGVEGALRGYGFDPADAYTSIREGVLSLTRWTSRLRARINGMPGHAKLMSSLRRAAFTADGALLFVHTGIDPGRPLEMQSDTLWWGGQHFMALDEPYRGYRRVIRGYDPQHGGVMEAAYATSVDGGCGFGGQLRATCFDGVGQIQDQIAV